MTRIVADSPDDTHKVDGDVSAVALPSGRVLVFGRNFNNDVVVYQFNPTSTVDWRVSEALFENWSSYVLPAPAGADAGILVGNPAAYRAANGQVFAVLTTSTGHLIKYSNRPSVAAVDLTDAAGAAADEVVYADVAIVADGATQYIYGTNQRGALVQYTDNGTVSSHAFEIPMVGGELDRSQMVFQSVNASKQPDANGRRHVYATDGHSRLVHFAISGAQQADTIENVTQQVLANGTDRGYFDFQKPFAGRVYSDLAVLTNAAGRDFVYGTNGNDLVLFSRDGDGKMAGRKPNERCLFDLWQRWRLITQRFVSDTGEQSIRITGRLRQRPR